MTDTGYECCLCGKTFTDWGNDPYPVNMDPNAKCCDACCMGLVVPVRMVRIVAKSKGERV